MSRIAAPKVVLARGYSRNRFQPFQLQHFGWPRATLLPVGTFEKKPAHMFDAACSAFRNIYTCDLRRVHFLGVW